MGKEPNKNRLTSWIDVSITSVLAIVAQELTEKSLGKWSLGIFVMTFLAVDSFFSNIRKNEESLEKENKELKKQLNMREDKTKQKSQPVSSISYHSNHAAKIQSEPQQESSLKL